MYNGILLINKPVDLTSYDVIRRIKPSLPKKQKIGHAGSLDPFATGLLIVTLGKATKLFDRFQELPKQYLVTGEFGYETDTQDSTGKKILNDPDYAKKINKEKIENILQNFKGEIYQKPPKYSAKRIQGKRAYELAREQKDFGIEKKKVFIYEIKLKDYSKNNFTLEIESSKGTYIRTVVVDIARELDTYATPISLTRIAIGEYSLKDSVDLNELEIEKDLVDLKDVYL